MSFQYQSYSIADISVSSIDGHTGLGVSQISFTVNFALTYTQSPPIVIRDIRARIDVTTSSGGTTKYLGRAETESAWEIRTSEYGGQSWPNQFHLTLAEGQLAALEQFRQGLGLSFLFNISANVHGDNNTFPQSESARFSLNAEDWLKVLAKIGGEEYLVVALPLPKCNAHSSLDGALNALKKAHKALLVGHYEQVVSLCRISVESAEKACDQSASIREALELFRSKKQAMSKLQRQLLIEEATRHYAHLAHHPGSSGAMEVFSRDDAVLLLSATAGILASCSQRLAAR